MSRSLVLLLLAVSVVIVSGCGGSDRPATAPVQGTVMLDDKPVEGAAVMFMPVKGGRPAHGVTDAEGAFTLTTIEPGDGALLGEHQVTVTLQEVSGIVETGDGLSGAVGPEGLQEKWIVPQKYSDPQTSGLKETVSEEMPLVKLKLTTG